MSFHVYFMMSSGLAGIIKVPIGTKAAILAHVADVEQKLGLVAERYQDNPLHWTRPADRGVIKTFSDIDDDVLCKTVEHHNHWVRWLYDRIQEWGDKPVADGEDLTPEDAAQFWHGLEMLQVDPERWNRDYYRARMQELYDVMRGRRAGGMELDAKPLSIKQAAAVVCIFDQYLDPNDDRLDVPDGHDYLASSYDGGYDWCETCGKCIAPDDIGSCRRKKCALRDEDE